jgi:hypothetical protein
MKAMVLEDFGGPENFQWAIYRFHYPMFWDAMWPEQ